MTSQGGSEEPCIWPSACKVTSLFCYCCYVSSTFILETEIGGFRGVKWVFQKYLTKYAEKVGWGRTDGTIPECHWSYLLPSKGKAPVVPLRQEARTWAVLYRECAFSSGKRQTYLAKGSGIYMWDTELGMLMLGLKYSEPLEKWGS